MMAEKNYNSEDGLKKYLNYNTIKGKTFLLITFFIVVLISLSVIYLIQNQKIKQINNEIHAIRMPLLDQITQLEKMVLLSQSTIKNQLVIKDSLKTAANRDEQINSLLEKINGYAAQLPEFENFHTDTLGIYVKEVFINEDGIKGFINGKLVSSNLSKVKIYEVDPFVLNVIDTDSSSHLEYKIEGEDAFYVGASWAYTHPGYSGRGYVDFMHSTHDYLEFTFNIPFDGDYEFIINYSLGSVAKSTRPLKITIDNEVLFESFDFTPTASFYEYRTTDPIKVTLDKGVHSLRLSAIGSSGGNMDYLLIKTSVPSGLVAKAGLVSTQERQVILRSDQGLTKELIDKKLDDELVNLEVVPIIDQMRDIYARINTMMNQAKNLNNKNLALQRERLEQLIRNTNIFISIIAIGSIVLSIIISYSVITTVNRSFKKPLQLLRKLAKGELAENADPTKDEMGEIILAGNQLNEKIQRASEFAKNIGDGNFNIELQASSEKDILGNSLLQMKEQLSKLSEEEKKRQWTTEGLANFAELLRKNYEDTTQLGRTIISELVKYLKVNQGAIFIVKEEEQGHKVLELTGAYAYERVKYIKKKINIGEGLVGQAFLEKAKIYITKVPENYVLIRSGLGGSNPDCLLIVPLINNGIVEGVLELASFRKLQDFEILFVEKVAETIAAMLNSLNINLNTKVLLEESEARRHELQAQEEEMRQNMEELEATQEEMARKSKELDKVIVEFQEKEMAFKENEKVLKEKISQLERQLKNGGATS